MDIKDLAPFALMLVIATIVLMAGSSILDSLNTQFSDTTSVSEEEFTGVAGTWHALSYMKVLDGSESLYNQTNATAMNASLTDGKCSAAVNGTHTFGNANSRYATSGGVANIHIEYAYNSTCVVWVEGYQVATLDGVTPDDLRIDMANFSGSVISVVYNSTAGDTNITRTNMNYLYFQDTGTGYSMGYYTGEVLPTGSDNYSMDYQYHSSTSAADASKEGLEGVENMSEWLPTIGLLVSAAVVIGIVMTSFS